jgi:hypothetical protein
MKRRATYSLIVLAMLLSACSASEISIHCKPMPFNVGTFCYNDRYKAIHYPMGSGHGMVYGFYGPYDNTNDPHQLIFEFFGPDGPLQIRWRDL